MDSERKDDRFSHITNDPRFKRIPKARRKVKIDSRFQSMFKDDKFKFSYSVDKRGRAVKGSTKEDLKRFYELSSDENSSSDDDEEDDNENEEPKEDEPGRFVRPPKSELNDNAIPETLKKKLTDLNVDYARGEAKLQSDSSSSDDDDSDVSEISETEDVDHNWGELDKDAESTAEATNRLAVCNMDWDRIRAIDLMVLLNSFLPPGGIILSVTIYPSEFGLKRMEEEEKHGPSELVNQQPPKKLDEENMHEDEDEMGSNYHVEKLRQYQLNRLKYYYAIVECDSARTADVLYKECDGLEYESSATKLDLRFVPDDTEFDHEPKETCTKLPDISKYQPRYFTTTALQQAKVELTWDETSHQRTEIAQKLASGKVDDIPDDVLQDYLASSSGEDDSDSDEHENNDPLTEAIDPDSKKPKSDLEMIDKYKQLLEDYDKNEENQNSNDIEMEISWGVQLQKKTDQVMKQKKTLTDQLTPFEKYLEKRKDKRKEKKTERLKKIKENQQHSAGSDDDDDDDSNLSDDDDDDLLVDKPKNKRKNNKLKTRRDDDEKKNEDDEIDTNTAELELLLMDRNGQKSISNTEENIINSPAKSKKKWKNRKDAKKKQQQKSKNDDDFQLNVHDKRFGALFVNHHFNIDPTDPNFKKTDATRSLIDEKLKRRSDTKDSSTVNVVKKRKK